MNARHQKPPCACPRDDSGQKEHVADCGNRLMTPLPLPSEAKATPVPLERAGLNKAEPPPKPDAGVAIWPLVIADMQERDRAGRAKYGTPLQANNGRRPLVDLYQELLDAVVYTRQEIEERAQPRDPSEALTAVSRRLVEVSEERDRYKRDHLEACHLVAQMHAAAVGGFGQAPKRGVLEDVQDVVDERDALRARVAELETEAMTLIEQSECGADEWKTQQARIAELEKEVARQRRNADFWRDGEANVEFEVGEFFAAMGIHAPLSYQPPSEPIRALRANMLVEEAHEFRAAAAAGNVPEMLDGAVDIIYVALGFFIETGLPFEPFWREVHASNMSKLGPDGRPMLREDGKILKGPGFRPPDIAGVLRRVLEQQQAEADRE